MARKLTMTFEMEAEATLSVSVNEPKDNLDAETVRAAAADLVPVLENSAGKAAVGLKSAKYVTTTEEAIL